MDGWRSGPVSGSSQGASCSCVKLRDKRGRIPLAPAARDFGQNFVPFFFHFQDQRAGRARFLVACSPDQQIEQYGGEVDSFLRQAVVHLAGVVGLDFPLEDSAVFQLLQTVGEHIGCDAFAGLLKFFERLVAAHHQITDDQQRPAVAEDFQANIDRAAGAVFGLGVDGHGGYGNNITCKMQVIFAGVSETQIPPASLRSRAGMTRLKNNSE